MSTQAQELFPRHLLVSVDTNQQVYTTSRRVAEHFGRLHQNVLRSIEQLIAEMPESRFTELNFEFSEYTDPTGRTLPEYHLTHDGFALLAMGFTGREAMHWKVSFLEAFRTLERQLRELTDQKANALDTLHPHWPVIRDGTIKGLSRQQLCDLTGHKHPSSITANRRRLRELGLLPATSGQVDIITH